MKRQVTSYRLRVASKENKIQNAKKDTGCELRLLLSLKLPRNDKKLCSRCELSDIILYSREKCKVN